MDRQALYNDAEKIGEAAVQQLAIRFKAYTGKDAPANMFNEDAYAAFFRYVVGVASEDSSALIKPFHWLGVMRPGEKGPFQDIVQATISAYEQILGKAITSDHREIVFYPRAAIIADKVAADVNKEKAFSDRFVAQAVRTNIQIASPAHPFITEKEYFATLKNDIVRKIMLNPDYVQENKHYGLFRCDITLSPGIKQLQRGWFIPGKTEEKTAVLIIPGISGADLEALISWEKSKLNLP
jgi:hypothetical protein